MLLKSCRSVGSSIVVGSLALAALAFPARASTVAILDVISSSTIDSTSGANLGTVTLTQNGPDEVDVSVALAANTAFVSTGGPHNAFAFNLNVSGASIAITNPTGNIFKVDGNGTNTPYGSFTNVIDCPGCGPGASNANPGPLTFAVTDLSGLSVANFVANSGGYYFSADVIGPSGGTGDIAANDPSATPLPEALPLFATGLCALGLLALRRKQKKPVSAFASANA